MKHVFFLFLALVLSLGSAIAQPANNWTADMPSSKIPSGVTLNDVDTLTSPVKLRFSTDLDATTYDNASTTTAFNAIGAATTTYILNTWLGAHAIDTADISTLIIVLKNVDRRWDNFDHPDPIDQYLVAEDIYRVTGIVKYTVE